MQNKNANTIIQYLTFIIFNLIQHLFAHYQFFIMNEVIPHHF